MNPFLNFLERLKLSTKLVFGLGAMMAITIAIGLQAIHSIRLQSKEINRMYELELQGLSHIKEATIEFMQTGRSLRQVILSPDAKSRANARADLGEARTKMNRELKSSDALFVRPEGRALLADIQDMMAQYLRNVDHALTLIDNEKALQNTEITRFLASPENVLVFEKTDRLMTDLVRHKEAVAKLEAQSAIEFSHEIEHWTVALLLLGVAAGMGAGVLLSISVQRPSERLRLSVEKLAQGELETRVPHTEFENEVGALARSVSVLQQGAAHADVLSWSKTQANLISANVQAIERVNEFGDTLLAQLTPLLQAQLSLLYVFDKETEKYRCQGAYGLSMDAAQMPAIALGEGLLGQCARDALPIQLDAVPGSSLRIRSGLIDDRARCVYLRPVCDTTGAVLAVLELASVAPLGKRQETLLQEVVQLVALNLKIIERNQATQTLFLQTQQQSDALRRQNIEIDLERNRAEEATRAKSEFLANMSHEIRTPMNAVIGLSYLALKTELSAQQRDYVQKIHSEGTTLLGILNDILDFSKMEADKMTLENAPFWLDDVLDSVSTLVAHKAQEKGIEFLIRVMPDVPQNLLGDSLRFKQVLTNLLHNAIKFTERGQVKVTMAVAQRRDERIEFSISVKDTGIGMSADQCKRLFNAFSQADSSTTRRFGGTGLGLAISRRFVELMDGNIRVESELGAGSTFTYSIWLRESEQPARALQRAHLAQGVRVLVVDDNPAARQILTEQLSALGLRAEEALGGQQGLDALQQADASDPYQVVLMDWQMPDMDGIETTWHISNDLKLQHQPTVVMVTAYGADEARKAGGSVGASAFLDKPVSQSRLWDTLIDIISPQLPSENLSLNRGEGYAALTGVQVLLVEDNDINQQIACELLQSMGVAVTLADNGKQAVDLLQGAPDPLPWDLVLMDLQMPVMDGHEATRVLRLDKRFASLPIIALTAHASAEEGARCLREGMNGHLTKPIEPAALHGAVAYWSKSATAGKRWQISGIDTDQGLLQCAGNRPLYESLLQRFVQSLVHSPTELRQALDADDMTAAERRAHTLKGVAANLGAGVCSRLSAELEKMIRERQAVPVLLAQLATLEQHLNDLARAIGEALPAAPTAPQTSVVKVDPAQLQRVCRELAELLHSSNVEARLLLKDQTTLLRSGLGEQFESIQSLVQDFEFSQALTALYDAANAVQLELP